MAGTGLDRIRPAYTPVARALHWIMALLVLGLIPVGIVMGQLDSGPLQDRLYNLHRSVGALILPLVIIRLVYRFTHPPLPLTGDIPAFQRLIAEATHWGLYTLLVLQPLVGWAATSAYGAAITVFGLFELPSILAQNEPLSMRLFALHRLFGFVMAAMVLAHAGAALFHHFIRRDRVLMRMVSGG